MRFAVGMVGWALLAASSTISTSGPIRLNATPTTVRLNTAAVGDPSLSRFSIVLRGLTAAAPPGVVYNLYLDLPEGATPGKEDARFIGEINFFGVTQDPQSDRFLNFEITPQLRRALAKRPSTRPLTVTIRPVGVPSAAAEAAIQQLELVKH